MLKPGASRIGAWSNDGLALWSQLVRRIEAGQPTASLRRKTRRNAATPECTQIYKLKVRIHSRRIWWTFACPTVKTSACVPHRNPSRRTARNGADPLEAEIPCRLPHGGGDTGSAQRPG